MKKIIKTYFSTNPNVLVNAKILGKKLKVKKKDYEFFKSEMHCTSERGFS